MNLFEYQYFFPRKLERRTLSKLIQFRIQNAFQSNLKIIVHLVKIQDYNLKSNPKKKPELQTSQSLTQHYTPHCNDDLNIINEQRIPMVNSSNLVLWQCKIAIFKIRSPALLEGRLYTGRKIRQIGQNGLCMPTSISKRAGDMISKMAILHCKSTKLLKLTIGLPCSFIILRSSLQ